MRIELFKKFKRYPKKEIHYKNYYDKEGLRNKLELTGFKIEKKEYYLTSSFSDYWHSLGIKFGYVGWLLYLFPIVYPLTLLLDKIKGNDKGGVGIAVKCIKSNN